MRKRTKKNNTIRAVGTIPERIEAVGELPFADLKFHAASEGESPKRPTFSMQAYTGGEMRVSGFYRPVVVDLAGLRASPSVTILRDHDPMQIVGQATDVKISAEGVELVGMITGDDGPAAEVVGHARNGFRWPVSIGASVRKMESLGPDQTAKVNGREFTGPLYVVRAGVLREVSFVGIGADENATANVAAGADNIGELEMNFEKWLEARGVVRSALTDEQVELLRASYEAEQEPEIKVEAADKPVDPTAQMREQAAAEANRIAEVSKVCAEHAEIRAKAISEGWDATQAELAVLKASRPKAPEAGGGSTAPATAEVLEAAAVISGGGIEKPEEHYSEQVLDAAHKQFRHGIGLQELLMEAALANGYTGRSFRQDMEGVLRAAFSTLSLSGIMGNVANKMLLAGFNAVESDWRSIASTASVKDFKAVTSYRLTGNMEYDEVGPTGELKHGTVDEESFTNQAKTYGRMFAITRTDLINDDLGALTAVPQKIGRGAALKLNKIFWTEFLDNASFFAGGNSNIGTGTLSADATGLTSLEAASLLFLNQTDPDGDPLGIQPATLLVPNALWVAARNLMSSTAFTGGSAKTPAANPFAGMFDVIRSSYLSNASISGYSASAWYLLANPADLPVIEVAFLNGVQTPTVERADASFNTLGVQFRGYHDFGVSKQDYRAGVKMSAA